MGADPVRRRVRYRNQVPETGRYPWLVREERKVYEAREDGRLARKRRRFRLVDVFGGAGGMTLGFSKAFGHAFDPVWANDFDGSCVSTYNANFGDHSEPGDIVSILEDARVTIPQQDSVSEDQGQQSGCQETRDALGPDTGFRGSKAREFRRARPKS